MSKKFKKYLSIFLSLILMLQIIAFPSACAEVFETFRNKQGNEPSSVQRPCQAYMGQCHDAL